MAAAASSAARPGRDHGWALPTTAPAMARTPVIAHTTHSAGTRRAAGGAAELLGSSERSAGVVASGIRVESAWSAGEGRAQLSPQEASAQEEPAHWEPPHGEPAHDDPPHDEPPHEEPPHDEPPHDEPPHDEPPHDEPPHEEPPHWEPPHWEPAAMTSAPETPKNVAGVSPALAAPVSVLIVAPKASSSPAPRPAAGCTDEAIRALAVRRALTWLGVRAGVRDRTRAAAPAVMADENDVPDPLK